MTWLDDCGMLPAMVTRYLLLGVLLYLYPQTSWWLVFLWAVICYLKWR